MNHDSFIIFQLIKHTYIFPDNSTCGLITRVERQARIVGGDAALEGEWPWQAAFVNAYGSQFCGGTLITPDVVLTAAHCFQT